MTRERGFTLIELLTALGMFLLVCGAAFTLLSSSQQRYRTESQVLTSFQEARLGLDQIVRDVNDSGFPPPTFNGGSHTLFADSPFAWSPGYPTPGNPSGSPCAIGTGGGGTCTTPGDFDLIIETNPNPQDPGSTVQWIRYRLEGTTLMRGTVGKAWGSDPDSYTTTNGQLAPFVQNVVNNLAQPIFSYTCDTSTAPQPAPCPSLGADNSPANIRDVMITLIVRAPLPDATTGQQRLVVLNGRGRRINPNQ